MKVWLQPGASSYTTARCCRTRMLWNSSQPTSSAGLGSGAKKWPIRPWTSRQGRPLRSSARPQRVLERRQGEARRDHQDRQHSRAPRHRRGRLELPTSPRVRPARTRSPARPAAQRRRVRSQVAVPAPPALLAPRRARQALPGRGHSRRAGAVRFRLGTDGRLTPTSTHVHAEGARAADGRGHERRILACSVRQGLAARTRVVRGRHLRTAHCHAALPEATRES
jgi:hypothetical protein